MALKRLNNTWLERLGEVDCFFNEKMTLFWHNHFACKTNDPYQMQELNNIMRKHALGNFRTLLTEVSKSPAMLLYLNNAQNKKDKINENFARELMELFTLGIGNYTEKDIKEGARALTGWGFNRKTTAFIFIKSRHDYGEKTFLGKTGNFNGDDIIDIILGNKQTAYFITKKVYKYFINERVDEKLVETLASNFYKSDYDISLLMREILLSDWFYEEENSGVLIKTPIHLLVGFKVQFGFELVNAKKNFKLQKALKQTLFEPPNVAGWPGGKDWIDNSTLFLRMKLGATLLNDGRINFIEEDNDENMMEDSGKGEYGYSFNWHLLEQKFPENVRTYDFFLISDINEAVRKLINAESSFEGKVLKTISLPEFQMC